ncbi:MAG TPA: hypothetical protein VLF93_02730 [Candidatus Saccharimonadales bacterium]|nr:hypothetical protein [Candidatus Saccharimonadales bacterium]
MSRTETLLDRLPRLDLESAQRRSGIEILGKPKEKTKKSRYEIFNHDSVEQPTWSEIPNIEYLARLARRETILQRRNETVESIAKEHDHTQPAAIANSSIEIHTNQGSGWLPVEASIRNFQWHLSENDVNLKAELQDIKEIFVVQHGVMRNAKDYFQYFMEALRKAGREYDPKTMLVIAPQFCAPVDLKGKEKLWSNKVDASDVLRWRYNDWRGAEPAMNPDAPIDSFTAMDVLLQRIISKTTNLERLEFIGNSEGAQFVDRYAASSKFLNQLEYHSPDDNTPTVEATVTNAGTALYFGPERPIFNTNGEIIGWNEDYTFDSEENTWPLGLYDPPPYVLESLSEWPHADQEEYPGEPTNMSSYDFMLFNYLNRIILSIGTGDNNPRGSQLPKGPGKGYRAQGKTRLQRFLGKVEHLDRLRERKYLERLILPQFSIITVRGYGHNAKDIFEAIEIGNERYKEAE